MLSLSDFSNISQSVLNIIKKEQEAQNNNFIPNFDYLKKLSEQAELIVHQNGNSVLGFVYFYCNSEKKDFSYITLIGTSSEARGQGIAYGLVNQVFFITQQRGFKECRLEVRKENINAFNLYKKTGFEVIEDRGDKYLMSKSFRYAVKLKDDHKFNAIEVEVVRDLELPTPEERWPLVGENSNVEVYCLGTKKECEVFLAKIENDYIREQFEMFLIL